MNHLTTFLARRIDSPTTPSFRAVSCLILSVSLLLTFGCGGKTVPPAEPNPLPTPATEPTPRGSRTPVIDSVQAFIDTLDPAQRVLLLHEHTFANASRWHTYPQWALRSEEARLGLALGSLSTQQRQAFDALLKAATGSGADEGYDEIRQHLDADDWIRENGGREGYGSGNFYVAILGTPAAIGTWQLQFGGHHLALNNTYRDGVLVGATPSFRAVEPHTAIEYDGKRLAPQLQEWQAFVALLASLDAPQQAQARLSRQQDVLLLGPESPTKDWNFPAAAEGISVSSLNADQRALLVKVIRLYVGDIPDTDATTILARYEAELDATRLAFSGSPALTEVSDYVRIDGPSVWIEFVMDPPYSTDSPHVHSVWRDKTSDYGGTRP